MKIILALFLLSFTLFGAAQPSISKYINTTQQKLPVQDDFSDDLDNEFSNEEEIKRVDPFEHYNRQMTSINDSIYIKVLIPVATNYAKVVPVDVREGISNVFSNLVFPIRFVNNILQLKFSNAVEETGRFIVNSTLGIFGFFDPAKNALKWEAHEEDFGQTLGFYGVGPGAHLVLPLLGPSNLRDMLSIIPDSVLNPTSEFFYDLPVDTSNGFVLNSIYFVNKASLHLGEYESIKKDAIDLYPFMRDLYEQNRISEIKE